ncbi:TraB/GumN family protein [Deferrisoma camini]|uniref:TraB/GumN family protein n=1 Tax=Deferrisoma camini TaxID=1035120 RepID=UPI00046CC41E|nr:TraB/GumN family protein [Deferrisoma camini]
MDPQWTRIELEDREVFLLGTAHVSRRSVEAVRRAVAKLEPDRVCVELDPDRLRALRDPDRWRRLDLVKALWKGQGPVLLANLALAAFQKRIGLATDVRPGEELLAAVEEAEARGTAVALVDRPIRLTLLRSWRRTRFWRKLGLFGALVASAFEDAELDEEDLARLRSTDTLSGLLEEMARAAPEAKEVLVDERDRYMAARILGVGGRRVLAVVGAAHVPGIARILREGSDPGDPSRLEELPPRGIVSRALPWVLPAIVLALFAAGFAAGDTAALRQAAWAWVLANGTLAAAGAAAALGHPLTVASAFVAAPLTSLNPTVGAGMVTGLVQAWAQRPRVRDLEGLLDDLAHWKGWWTNRVARVLLVFLFSNLGSALGTFVAFGWLKDLVG